MKDGKIGVGLIGASVATDRWGGRIHGPIYNTLPETSLVAVCTSREETARTAADALGARHALTDYGKLVQMDDVDLVIVALRVDLHHPMVMEALEAGKHVFCEWPLAVTGEQAQQMYDLAREKNLCHAVGLQARCTPPIMYFRDLVAQGYIGRPLVVNVMFTHDRGFWRKLSNALFVDKKELGGSGLNGHAVDAALFCMGELQSLSSDMDTLIKEGTLDDTGETVEVTFDDNVALIGQFKNGAKLTAQISWTADPPRGVQIIAYGTEGCIIASNEGDYHFRDITLWGAKRMPTTDGNRGTRRVEAAPRVLPVPASYNWTPEFAEDSSQFPVAQVVRRLARGITDGAEVRPNFLDGLRLHRLLESMEESSRSRRWVDVAPGGVGSD